jgi:hypothetical protein
MCVQQGAITIDERTRGDRSDKVEIQALPEPVQLRNLSKCMERIRKENLVKIRPVIKVTPEKENVDIEIVEETEEDESSK